MPTRGSEATRAETRNRRLFWPNSPIFLKCVYEYFILINVEIIIWWTSTKQIILPGNDWQDYRLRQLFHFWLRYSQLSWQVARQHTGKNTVWFLLCNTKITFAWKMCFCDFLVKAKRYIWLIYRIIETRIPCYPMFYMASDLEEWGVMMILFCFQNVIKEFSKYCRVILNIVGIPLLN